MLHRDFGLSKIRFQVLFVQNSFTHTASRPDWFSADRLAIPSQQL
jgi:hypothetical protein